jgi:hypothetical protein
LEDFKTTICTSPCNLSVVATLNNLDVSQLFIVSGIAVTIAYALVN